MVAAGLLAVPVLFFLGTSWMLSGNYQSYELPLAAGERVDMRSLFDRGSPICVFGDGELLLGVQEELPMCEFGVLEEIYGADGFAGRIDSKCRLVRVPIERDKGLRGGMGCIPLGDSEPFVIERLPNGAIVWR